MNPENPLKTANISSFLLPTYPTALVMYCERLVSVVLNKTAILTTQSLTPPYIRQLFAKQNLTLRIPKNVSECVVELTRLLNSTNENRTIYVENEQDYGIQERSHSLIVFVFLIALVSFISIIGNLCLAKVLYSKRFRLLQTDRIVLCLALTELCLVLIDSPTEIYRFLSFSFSQTWLCRFHTFFESLFSSCIIFYHLLGAFDRFVYIYGHTSSDITLWSKLCHKISTKSGSIILLILPVLCSLPIATCNTLHAHVIHTSLRVQICIVQYAHKILISLLIFFYILPLLFTFFLHGKLIYFIRSKHHSSYLTNNSYTLPMKHKANSLDTQRKRTPNKILLVSQNQKQSNLRTRLVNTKPKRVVMFNNDTDRNAAGTLITSTTTTNNLAGQQVRAIANSSNSTVSSRSSNGTSFSSVTSPIILYKINSQANANAKRTVLLLVLLLSFYVLCWAPYNIYTWTHAYQITINNRNETYFDRTLSNDFNETITSLKNDNLHADLRRIIFVNYSLYLLSMISMCFSFLFYFSLNKHARQDLSNFIGCICPSAAYFKNNSSRQNNKKTLLNSRPLIYHQRYQDNYTNKNHPIMNITNNNNNNNNNNQRIKTTQFKTHQTYITPTALNTNKKLLNNNIQFRIDNQIAKRTVLTYGCHVQCCP